MASLIYLDTHVAAWLYADRLPAFPDPVQRLLNRCDLLVSPIVELELQYLFEIRRTSVPGADVVASLEAQIGLKVCDLPFRQVIAAALDLHWTRDPFDRIIVAQASLRHTPLLTRDEALRDNYPEAVWYDAP